MTRQLDNEYTIRIETREVFNETTQKLEIVKTVHAIGRIFDPLGATDMDKKGSQVVSSDTYDGTKTLKQLDIDCKTSLKAKGGVS